MEQEQADVTQASEGDHPESAGQLLILDSCSGNHWLEMAVSWHDSGGKVILLISPTANHGSEQLRLLYLGISGLVLMTAELDQELPRAVSTVLAGELWVKRGTLTKYVRRGKTKPEFASRESHFTPREEQVMSFLLRDYSNKRIADILGISERTVKYHVSNIFQKAQVSTRKELRAGTYGVPTDYSSERCAGVESWY